MQKGIERWAYIIQVNLKNTDVDRYYIRFKKYLKKNKGHQQTLLPPISHFSQRLW